jgi:hypothetical protein
MSKLTPLMRVALPPAAAASEIALPAFDRSRSLIVRPWKTS